MTTRYDHVIVGAGSAGSVLATRLSEGRGRSVLLLEAGPDCPVVERIPDEMRYAFGAAATIWDGRHTWNFDARTTYEADISVPKGRVTGGSSAVNDAQFLRPMPKISTCGPSGEPSVGIRKSPSFVLAHAAGFPAGHKPG